MSDHGGMNQCFVINPLIILRGLKTTVFYQHAPVSGLQHSNPVPADRRFCNQALDMVSMDLFRAYRFNQPVWTELARFRQALNSFYGGVKRHWHSSRISPANHPEFPGEHSGQNSFGCPLPGRETEQYCCKEGRTS